MDTVKVLDYGYVKFIESWGSDERIIEAARMSTDKGFLGWGPYTCPECEGTGQSASTIILECPISIFCTKCKGNGSIPGDEKLLEYLWTNHHATPFEMAGMTIEIQAPIFVFREWHRHRTQSYSELSARYTPLPDFNYLPSTERCLIVDPKNKQAGKVKGSADLDHASVLDWLAQLEGVYLHAQDVYLNGLQRGIPKEVARLPIPVGRYSRMRASANLRNWLAFLTLRMDSKAQWEIRQYANVVGSMIAQQYPRTWKLFNH